MSARPSATAQLVRRLPQLLAALDETAGPRVVAEETLRALVHCLVEGRTPTDADVQPLRAAAVRHAEDGTTLAALLAAGHDAARVVMAAVEQSDADEVLRVFELLVAAFSESYVEELHAIRAEERDARRALATALMSGEQIDWPEAHLGVRIAPAYIAVALQLEDLVDGMGDAAAARRRLRRMQEQLDRFSGEPVLGLLDPSGGTALLPTDVDGGPAAVDALPRLVTEIGEATGSAVLAGAAACVGVIAVARAVRQARDVLRIARRLQRPPGVYVLDDVLLEYQLTLDSDARPLLAGLLDSLDDHADLLHTLQCYFEHELDRRTTAATLHVHPNTLDYRLRRITQLTGVDVTKPSGQQLLAAALTARRLV